MTADHSILNFRGEISLEFKRKIRVRVSHCFEERFQHLSKMVASFLRHLCWQMINRVEEYAVVVGLSYLLIELPFESVIDQERFLNAGESVCEFNGTLEVC